MTGYTENIVAELKLHLTIHKSAYQLADLLASRFLIEHREDFTAWSHEKGIDPADAFAWARKRENQHKLASRLAETLPKFFGG